MGKLDIVEIEKNQDDKTIMYSRFERLYEHDFVYLKNTLKNQNIIFQNIKNGYSIIDFLDKVFQFEQEYNRSNNKVFALSFTILLPKAINTIDKKTKFVKSFRKMLFPDISIFLNYFVIEEKHGKGTYLKLIVFERALIDKEVVQRYKTDVFTYKIIDGVKHKIKTRSAKQIKKDNQGKKIKKYVAFSDKLRFFNFSCVAQLRDKLLWILESAIKSVFIVKYSDRLRFKRKTVYLSANKFKRAVAIEMNQAKVYIENRLNKYYKYFSSYLDSLPEAEYRFAIEKNYLSKILNLFYGIKHIFENNRLVIDDKELKINYKYILLPELKINLQKLIVYFESKMKKIEENLKKI